MTTIEFKTELKDDEDFLKLVRKGILTKDFFDEWINVCDTLNQKYSDFPCFTLDIDNNINHFNIVDEHAIDPKGYNIKYHCDNNQYNLVVSLKFNGFPLASCLISFTNPINKNTTYMYSFSYDQIYSYEIDRNRNICTTPLTSDLKTNFNLYEHLMWLYAAWLKHQHTNSFGVFLYEQLYRSNDANYISLFNYNKKVDLNGLLTTNLYPVILLLLDLLNPDHKKSRALLSVYHTNVLKRNEHLVYDSFRAYINEPGIIYCNSLFPLGLNHIWPLSDSTDTHISYYRQEFETSYLPANIYYARLYADFIYLSDLMWFNNTKYDESDLFTSMPDFLDNKLGLNTLKTKTQRIKLLEYCHGTDLMKVYDPKQTDTIDLNTYYERTNNISHWYNEYDYYKLLNNPSDVLYQTITYEDKTKSGVFHTTLSIAELVLFFMRVYGSTSSMFTKNNPQANIALLQKTVDNKLVHLKSLSNTTNTYTHLTFKQDDTLPYYNQSEMFLTLSPILNPGVNSLLFSPFGDLGSNRAKSDSIPLINQAYNYITLKCRNSLTPIFQAFVTQNQNWAEIYTAYYIFLLTLKRYFKINTLYSNTYGFLTPIINFTGLMFLQFTFIKTKYDKPVNNEELKQVNVFYDQFLNAFYSASKNFSKAWLDIITHKEEVQDGEEEPFIQQLIEEIGYDYKTPTNLLLPNLDFITFEKNFNDAVKDWREESPYTIYDVEEKAMKCKTKLNALTNTQFKNTPYYQLIDQIMQEILLQIPDLSIKSYESYKTFATNLNNNTTNELLNMSLTPLDEKAYFANNFKKRL